VARAGEGSNGGRLASPAVLMEAVYDSPTSAEEGTAVMMVPYVFL
jgi:hypothetical protein